MAPWDSKFWIRLWGQHILLYLVSTLLLPLFFLLHRLYILNLVFWRNISFLTCGLSLFFSQQNYEKVYQLIKIVDGKEKKPMPKHNYNRLTRVNALVMTSQTSTFIPIHEHWWCILHKHWYVICLFDSKIQTCYLICLPSSNKPSELFSQF